MQQVIEVTELEPANELMSANSFRSKTYQNWCYKEMERINNKLASNGQRPDADVGFSTVEDQVLCQVVRIITEGEQDHAKNQNRQTDGCSGSGMA